MNVVALCSKFVMLYIIYRFLSHTVNNNVTFQGLKRSVTTLRGGTIGYAEIVAVKVRFDSPSAGFGYLKLMLHQFLCSRILFLWHSYITIKSAIWKRPDSITTWARFFANLELKSVFEIGWLIHLGYCVNSVNQNIN